MNTIKYQSILVQPPCYFGNVLKGTPLNGITCTQNKQYITFDKLRDRNEQFMISSRCLQNQVVGNVEICEDHYKALGKNYKNNNKHMCRWAKHNEIQTRLGRKDARYKAKSLKEIARPESYYLYYQKKVFFPFQVAYMSLSCNGHQIL